MFEFIYAFFMCPFIGKILTDLALLIALIAILINSKRIAKVENLPSVKDFLKTQKKKKK